MMNNETRCLVMTTLWKEGSSDRGSLFTKRCKTLMMLNDTLRLTFSRKINFLNTSWLTYR